MPETQAKHYRRSTGNHSDECLVCFENKLKNGNLLSLFWDEDYLCHKCRSKLHMVDKTIEIGGVECEVLYEYDEEFSKLLIQYKELYDEALYPVFVYPYIRKIDRKYRGYTLVSVPSTRSNIEKRGFHHVNQMFSQTALDQKELFIKLETGDQKNNSMGVRKQVGSYIRLQDNIKLPQTPILVADDVITSSESMTACLRLLKDHSYPVKGIAISANKKWFKR